jgi:hypothetical protein
MQLIVPPNGIETTLSPPSETHKFRLIGTDDKNTAISYAVGSTPSFKISLTAILYRQDIQISRAAYNQWDVTVPYLPQKVESGEWTWDFDTTGGTVHITQARQEVARYPAATAPDQLGAIAVDGDEVKGVEIVIPAMKINVQYKHPLGVLTLAKAKFLANITGTVNSDSFLTFAPGEVLFLGARGSDGTESEASVSYSFAMSVNETGLTIGNIAGVAKKGWDVAWIRYHDTITVTEAEGDTEEHPTRVPKHVYVDRVYETIPMATALGFG